MTKTRLLSEFQRLITAGNTPTEAARQLGSFPRSTASTVPKVAQGRLSPESRNIRAMLDSLPTKTRKAVMKEFLKEGQDFQLGVHVRTGGSW